MEKIIYVQLLNEGTKVFRPVPAIEVGNFIFEIMGSDIYKPEDETWEFLPNTCVLVEEKKLSKKNVLVAIKEQRPI